MTAGLNTCWKISRSAATLPFEDDEEDELFDELLDDECLEVDELELTATAPSGASNEKTTS